MRRNGFRVVQKDLKTFYDGTRKANLDVEIAVDMLSLAGKYDTAVLVSGDEDFVYALNAVAYKGCRVEVAGFRSNTAPHLIDVADFFIDLGDIAELVSKDATSEDDYEIPSFIPPEEMAPPEMILNKTEDKNNRSQNDKSIQKDYSDEENEKEEKVSESSTKINFEQTFSDEGSNDSSNLVRVTDDV